jgi:predicted glycosyltransferase
MNGTVRRMMIYSQDGFGLGHLRRNLNIAIQVQRRAPGVSVLLVADSPAAPFFKLPPSCDFLKIPTLVKVSAGEWRSDRLSLGDRALLAIRSTLIRDVTLSFRPDLFLVDHMPCGARGELALTLEAIREHRLPTRLVLGLRDILGAPGDICPQWHSDQHYAATTEHYDQVLVYGCRDLFDLVEEYRFTEAMLAKTQYCGYVSREHVRVGTAPANGKPRTPLVLVTGGGGADASFFIDKFLDATGILKSRMPIKALVATGPFMHADQHRWLNAKAKGLPVRVAHVSQDNLRLMRRADVVVSMAGYNTISEILRFRKKAVVIPRPGPSAEQTMRTRLMGERGLFDTIHPHDLTAEDLARSIAAGVQRSEPLDPSLIPRLDGASQAAAMMLEPSGVVP